MFRMGYIIALLLSSVAVATRVLLQNSTGTAFVQEGHETNFYDDIVKSTIYVEFPAPRILLDHQQYTECDESFRINEEPLCSFQFSEFDSMIHNFLNLGLVSKSPNLNQPKIRKKRQIQRTIVDPYPLTYINTKNGTNNLTWRDFIITPTTQPTIRKLENSLWVKLWKEMVKNVLDLSAELHSTKIPILHIGAPKSVKKSETLALSRTILEMGEKFKIQAEKIAKKANTQSIIATVFGSIIPMIPVNQIITPIVNRHITGSEMKKAEILRQKHADCLKMSTSINQFLQEETKIYEPTLRTSNFTISEVDHKSSATQPRQKRFVVETGIVLISVGSAVGGYFIGKSVEQVGLEQAQKDIEEHKKAILSLNKAVQITENNLKEIAEMLQVNENLVLTGSNTLPFEINFSASGVKAGKLNTKFDIQTALHISRLNTAEFLQFKNQVLTLQNSRLPLQTSFLLALRAECLSLQINSGDKEMAYCNDVAFHATRWDTALKFEGVGLSYIDDKNTKIRSIIYGFTTDIPILSVKNLERYSVINLGLFQAKQIMKKVLLPPDAVISKSGIIHPFNKNKCMSLASGLACPSSAIATYDPCLHAVFNGTDSSSCHTVKIRSQTTCISQMKENYAIVSMMNSEKIHYDLAHNRHMHQIASVGKFDIVNRTSENGVIFCEKSDYQHVPPELRIPKRKRMITSTYTASTIPINHQGILKKTTDDKLEELKNQMDVQSEVLSKSTENIIEKAKITNSTIEKVKENMKVAFANLPTTIGTHLKDFLLPIITPIAVALGLLLIIVLAMIYIFQRCKTRIEQRECFAVPNHKANIPKKDDRDNRTDEASV